MNTPFVEGEYPIVFVQGVGLLTPPDTEVRATNSLDYWTTSMTNSLGFLDREPVNAERAGMSCHIAMIGDSFVEARHVLLHEKSHIRLESLASQELPDLDVTAAAYGFSGTGQINQLAYYDHYARRLRPNIVALVFVNNDFGENHPALLGALLGLEPDQIPFVSAERDQGGAWRIRPPSRQFSPLPTPQSEPSPPSLRWSVRHLRWSVRQLLARNSYIGRWLFAKRNAWALKEREPNFEAAAKAISQLPRYESFLDGWEPTTRRDVHETFKQEELPPVFQEAMEATSFALDEFQRRAERDGAALVILASYTMGASGAPLFERLAAMAGEREIPVINQSDYIERIGGKIEDAHFEHDWHWSAQGHQWAAEALLEWLRENPQVCRDE